MNIQSPCIEVCKLSEDKTVCVGCYRSLAEIAAWGRLSDPEKLGVIAAARQRRSQLESQTQSEQVLP